MFSVVLSWTNEAQDPVVQQPDKKMMSLSLCCQQPPGDTELYKECSLVFILSCDPAIRKYMAD